MTRFRRLGGPHRVDHRKLLGMLESDIFVATQLLTTKKIHSFFFFFDWIYTIERIKLVRFLIGREPSPLHGKRIAIHFLPDRDKMGWMLFSSSLQSSALYSKVSNILSVISDIWVLPFVFTLEKKILFMNIRGAIFHSFYYLTHKNGSSYFSVERVYIHSLTPSVWTWEKRRRFQINTKIGFGHPTTWKKKEKFLSELMMKNLFIVHAKKSALSVGGLARTFARTCNFRCVYIMRQHLFSKENEEQIPSDKKKKKKNFVNV